MQHPQSTRKEFDAMARLPNADDLLTLEEAAHYLGYRSPSTLRTAVREGRLQVIRHGARTILTTVDWVYAYEDAIAGKGGRPRGCVAPPRPAPEVPSNTNQR